MEPLKLQLRDYVSSYREHYFGHKLAYHQSYYEKLFKDTPPKLKITSKNSRKKRETVKKAFNILEDPQRTEKSEGLGYGFMISKEILDQIRIVTSELK